MLSSPSVNPKASLADATGSSDACCALTVLTSEAANSSAHVVPPLERHFARITDPRNYLNQVGLSLDVTSWRTQTAYCIGTAIRFKERHCVTRNMWSVGSDVDVPEPLQRHAACGNIALWQLIASVLLQSPDDPEQCRPVLRIPSLQPGA
jgi:hypothetical protein